MTTASEVHEQIRAFGETFDYDASYLSWLYDTNPEAFAAFQAVKGMTEYRKLLSLEAHFVVRIAAHHADGCGACAQLNLRMAQAAGADEALLAAIVEGPTALPEEHRDLWEHASAVARGEAGDSERLQRIVLRHGDGAPGEIGVVICGALSYPTMKRSLLRETSCTKLRLP